LLPAFDNPGRFLFCYTSAQLKRVFDSETIAMMRSMAKKGHSAPEIARKIGSTDGSVRVLASRMGIRFQARVFNDKAVAVMRRMARNGKSAAEIAKAIGSTNGSVRTLASRLGIRLQSRQKGRKPTDMVTVSVLIPHSKWARLSSLAQQRGFKSASGLMRNRLEQVLKKVGPGAWRPFVRP
jgi:hypothetical protein